MEGQSEEEPLVKEENDNSSRWNLCIKNGYYFLGTSLALAGVICFVGSLASLQMVQVRKLYFTCFIPFGDDIKFMKSCKSNQLFTPFMPSRRFL